MATELRDANEVYAEQVAQAAAAVAASLSTVEAQQAQYALFLREPSGVLPPGVADPPVAT